MQTILLFLSSLTMLAGAPHHSPPSGSSQGPSPTAWLTLVCGIVSWFMLPLVASILGFFLGRGELKAIAEGRSPAAGETITKLGYYLSIANIVLTVVGGCISTAIVLLIWGGVIAGIGGLAIFSELAGHLP